MILSLVLAPFSMSFAAP
ncbi:hypothetical protein, partial [Faecalibaculum rodentium]